MQTPENTALDSRAGEFHAVQAGAETRSGTVLLVEAYAAIWLILFAFVWLSFRRQQKLDERITALESAIDEARKNTL